ncbi:hypothetical protein SAMN05421753_10846 [Planctomicrobium piriforme]|uniref:Uncharacterized protein n=1 Tax=Planctomicrobium piriforme TaxID=1576369 RepID=A0A1I3HFU3_9PLAN|nr:hypothetical protein SAMN05421753_10846 [Planctomicrobium piriforme]
MRLRAGIFGESIQTFESATEFVNQPPDRAVAAQFVM